MKKLLMILTLSGFAFISNAQYRSNDEGYKNYDNGNVRYGNERTRTNNNDYRHGGGATNSINSYQRNARTRIAQGIIEGTITSRESAKLLEMAERIEQKENRFARRGGLSTKEIDELKNDLNDLDYRISRERKDWDRQTNDDRRNRGFN